MKLSDLHARADLSIEIAWQKNQIKHTEHYYINGLNCWRDVREGHLLENILNLEPGEKFRVNVLPGEVVPEFQESKVLKLESSRQPLLIPHHRILPGRFYPQGMISGVPGIFRGNMNPFRIIEKADRFVVADINHPMAGIPFEFSLQLLDISRVSAERGGSVTDWVDQALSGPGMQGRAGDLPTRFLYDGALERQDESPDRLFYQADRFVGHIDRRAHRNVSDIHRRYIKSNDEILDLMAGWESHLPENINGLRVHGLGMNENELRRNPQLTDFSIQDLNQHQALSFPDNTFDAVICALSVEYLTDPVSVFKAVSRVLKPGGRFVVTFSNRCFPEKATHIWTELHEFERMGLILEYFFESGKFAGLETSSLRGHPRPENDKYAGELKQSDPIFAVSGKAV